MGSYPVVLRATDATGRTLDRTWTLTVATGTPVGTVFNFDYTGAVQSRTLPPGKYQFEVWGASMAQDGRFNFAKGGYARGTITLTTSRTFYIFVGQVGARRNSTGSWNGGGNSGQPYSEDGGGGTDIRLVNAAWNNANSLRSRILVAGAAGGFGQTGAGHGGGLEGTRGNNTSLWSSALGGYGGTQTAGGAGNSGGQAGSFGIGGGTPGARRGSGAGGYYGGGAGVGSSGGVAYQCGGGGSGFCSGHSGCRAVTSETSGTHVSHANHYSGLIFTATALIAGNASMPNPRGSGNITGNPGNGYARITSVA